MISNAAPVELGWLIIILSVLRCNVSATDPCFNYTDLNDNKYTTNNTAPRTNEGISQNGWHRVTSSTEGLLVRSCPTGNECGTMSQVWMNDTIPTYSSGETQVKICIRSGTSCCDRSHTMRMKNCNTFVVYYLLPVPPSSGYCFESSSSLLEPISTTIISPSSSSSTNAASTSLQQSTISAIDPCSNYTDLNDNRYTTNNTTPRTNGGFSVNGWYRVTSSTEGLLVRTCPTGNECGTTSQIWMNDTIPTYTTGETQVKVCIRSGKGCCDRSRTVRMKNCNTFVVYYLLRIPPASGYCFESSSSVLEPMSTTIMPPSTSSTTRTASTTAVKQSTSTTTNLPTAKTTSPSTVRPTTVLPTHMPTTAPSSVRPSTALPTNKPVATPSTVRPSTVLPTTRDPVTTPSTIRPLTARPAHVPTTTPSTVPTLKATDPCSYHTDLNNNIYTTNNTAPRTNEGFSQNGWYRVTSSTEGLLVQTCPTGNECGTTSQIWMNDTIPTYSNGETQVKVCIRSGKSCCDRSRTVRMKNCNTFVVYYLLRIPPASGYCFESSSSVLEPMSTTMMPPSTSSSTQTASTTAVKQSTSTTTPSSTTEITSPSTVSTAWPTHMPTTTPSTVRPTTALPVTTPSTIRPLTARPTHVPTTTRSTVPPSTALPTHEPTTTPSTVQPSTAMPTHEPTTIPSTIGLSPSTGRTDSHTTTPNNIVNTSEQQNKTIFVIIIASVSVAAFILLSIAICCCCRICR